MILFFFRDSKTNQHVFVPGKDQTEATRKVENWDKTGDFSCIGEIANIDNTKGPIAMLEVNYNTFLPFNLRFRLSTTHI